jgi:hypothetical protein
MRRIGWLLVVLLLWGQVDDILALQFSVPSAPATVDDDDEYLPSQRGPEAEESRVHTRPAFAGLKRRAAESSPVRWTLPFERDLSTPLTPLPLYVFMSLQI